MHLTRDWDFWSTMFAEHWQGYILVWSKAFQQTCCVLNLEMVREIWAWKFSVPLHRISQHWWLLQQLRWRNWCATDSYRPSWSALHVLLYLESHWAGFGSVYRGLDWKLYIDQNWQWTALWWSTIHQANVRSREVRSKHAKVPIIICGITSFDRSRWL